MRATKLVPIGLLVISIGFVSGCGMVAPSKCTTDNCVVAVASTNNAGMPVFQGENAPSYPPYPPAPTAAENLCTSLGGDWYKTDPNNSFAYYKDGKWHGVYVCENLPYIGSDGGSYYFSPVDITYGQLDIVQDPQVPSASYQECKSGVYPGRSAYISQAGIWVAQYGYCRP
jgi:hypothetical protein